MKTLKWILLALLIGCSNPAYRGEDALGAREFVLDSYKISQGKSSILVFEGRPIQPLSSDLLDEYPDTVADGDVLSLRFYHATRLHELGHLIDISRGGFEVHEGRVTLPEIGDIEVAGKTIVQAQTLLQKAYDKELGGIEVFVTYKERRGARVELAGMTALSHVPVNGKVRLFETLSLAKVPTQANLFKSYLVREDKLVPVDFQKLVREGDMTQNVVMRPGDKIYVAGPETSNIYLMGEVTRQGSYPMNSSSMPLREALAKAGGIAFTGDRAFIQVIRGNLTRPKIYTLTWNHLIHLPTSSMLLIPGDIVYVAATPITQWNRFINQLFPSFTAYEFFNKGIQGVIVQ